MGKGSAVVMVSDGGAGGDAHFDCILESFQDITGADTGIFDIEFEQVPCSDVTGTPVIINWADKNAHYCKMMFENIGGWGQLDSVKACLDNGSCSQMQQFAGATWIGCPTGTGNSMTFELMRVPWRVALARGGAMQLSDKLRAWGGCMIGPSVGSGAAPQASKGRIRCYFHAMAIVRAYVPRVDW